MNPEATIQNLGIRIANDAIQIATLEGDNAALRAEVARLSEPSPEE